MFKLSRERLDDDDFLVDTETVQHTEQVLPTPRHLPLHGQTEILLHSFGDPSRHCVVSTHENTDKQLLRLNDTHINYRRLSNELNQQYSAHEI